MSNTTDRFHRLNKLRTIAVFLAVVLFVKVLLTILLEYRHYFPPNFDATFLIGRRDSFNGIYPAAFYTHLISAPLALVLGSFLMWSGGRRFARRTHRWVGRGQMSVVFAAVVPSGLVMAREAFAGPVAGCGFAALSIATALSAAATIRHARLRQFAIHRRWATRCFILLASPLLFRLVSGGLIVLQWESDWAYRANAWFSWIVPVAIYEVWRIRPANQFIAPPHRETGQLTEEAV